MQAMQVALLRRYLECSSSSGSLLPIPELLLRDLTSCSNTMELLNQLRALAGAGLPEPGKGESAGVGGGGAPALLKCPRGQ